MEWNERKENKGVRIGRDAKGSEGTEKKGKERKGKERK